MKYAENTVVAVSKSRAEIEELIEKNGGQRFGVATEPGRAFVVFEMKDRRISFELALPKLEEFKSRKHPRYSYRTEDVPAEKAHANWEQACRSKWRALLLTIKAKLVSVDSKIETLEEAFLAHILVPTEDGQRRVGTLAIAAIQAAYVKGTMPPLLGAGS